MALDFFHDGVRVASEWLAVRDGLDDRIAESLPRRGHDDEIATGIRVVNGRPDGQSSTDAGHGRAKKSFEIRVEAVFGFPEQPVDATEFFGETKSRRYVLALNSPSRLQNHRGAGFHLDGLAHQIAAALWRVAVEMVGDGGRNDPALAKFEARAIVDGDVRPRSETLRTFQVSEVGPLPR